MSVRAAVAVDKKRVHRASQGDAITTSRHLEDAHGPAKPILPQPGLFGARGRGRWEHRDPQSEDVAVSVSAVPADLLRRRLRSRSFGRTNPPDLRGWGSRPLGTGAPPGGGPPRLRAPRGRG